MKKLFTALLLSLLTVMPAMAAGMPLESYRLPTDSRPVSRIAAATRPTYRVVRVVDGDTIELNINGRNEKVRLIGIDTPESVHPDRTRNSSAGITASNYTKRALEGKTVGVEQDVAERDRYGRLLLYVYLGNQMFNEQLLRDGMAVSRRYVPNVKYAERFERVQRDAQARKVGLWAGTSPLSLILSPASAVAPPRPTFKPVAPTAPVVKAQAASKGRIKGNISSKGERIYHMPGMRDYNKTQIDEGKGERWFETEAQARAAGWRKAKR